MSFVFLTFFFSFVFLTDIFPNGTEDMKSAKEMEEVNYMEIAETWKEEYEFEQNQ